MCQSYSSKKGATITALVLIFIALGVSICTFIHPDWVKYETATNGTEFLRNPRSKGILFECLNTATSGKPLLPQNAVEGVLNSRCVVNDFGQLTRPADSKFDYFKVFRLSQVILHGIGCLLLLVVLLISLGLLCKWCCAQKFDESFYWKSRIFTTVILLIATLCLLASPLIFLIVSPQEREISRAPTTALLMPSVWPSDIKSKTTFTDGYMYYLAWVGAGLSLLSTFLTCGTICYNPNHSKYEENNNSIGSTMENTTADQRKPNNKISDGYVDMNNRIPNGIENNAMNGMVVMQTTQSPRKLQRFTLDDV